MTRTASGLPMLPYVGPGAVTTASTGQQITGLQTDAYGRILSAIAVKGYANVTDTRFAGGAKGDGVTDDLPAIQAAIDSLKNRGGIVFFPATANYYAVSAQIALKNTVGNRYDNIILMGEGYASQIKPKSAFLGGGTAAVIFFEGNLVAYDLKNVGIKSLRVSGFDETTTGVAPVVAFAYTDTTFAIDSWIDTNADEGLYWNNPNIDQNVYITGCHITRVGGYGGSRTNDSRAAYNVNANNALVVGNHAFQVGQFVEHTGYSGVFVGNDFQYAALEGTTTPIYQTGVTIESPGGASGTNGRVVFSNNTIRYAGVAIAVGSQSTQSIILSNNSVEFCNTGISAISASQPISVHGNTFFDTIAGGGSQGSAIIVSGVGGAAVTGNRIFVGATPWAYGIYVNDTTSQAVISDNIVYGNAVTSVIFYAIAGNTKTEFFRNKVVDWGATIPGARDYYGWNNAFYTWNSYPGIAWSTTAFSPVEPSVVHSSAAPTTGTWKVGDRVVNTAPAASGALQWICTAGGTPGTWTALTLN